MRLATWNVNSIMDMTRAAGKLGIPGLYVTGDPGAVDEPAKVGSLSIRIGLGWAKSHSFTTGQCPVMKYNRELMMAILHDRTSIAKNVNAKPISLEEAPRGYADVVRPHTPGPGVYTYWDYTQLRFPRREGMRIDFLLGSAALAQRVTGAEIDRQERKGKGASDHAPVVVDLVE